MNLGCKLIDFLTGETILSDISILEIIFLGGWSVNTGNFIVFQYKVC